MDRFELKTEARIKIRGKIGTLFVINLIYLILTFVISFLVQLITGHSMSSFFGTSISGILEILICAGASISFAFIYLGIINENKTPAIGDLLIGYKEGNYIRALIADLRQGLFIILWGLLLVIPGIIKALSYSQMFYLLADNPEMTPAEAQKKSIKMMKGHKGELFVLG
ncbi:MAG: DUF975 family protein, partial [Bifidobacteriaceae bacterium]|nr:DUF975 family protein [Bifidobacteriaceae bacterium]